MSDRPRLLEELADTLWTERRIVELLLYKLVAAKLFLAADDRRFTPYALDEVERVVVLLRESEAGRSRSVAAVASAWGAPVESLTLAELATHAPEPLRTVFRDHQEAFRRMAEEIEATSATNRRLASAALGHVRQSLEGLTGPPVGATYTAQGRADVGTGVPLRLDQVL